MRADRRTGRLSAFSAARQRTPQRSLVDRVVDGRAPAGSSSARSSYWPARFSPFSQSARAWPRTRPPIRPRCICEAFRYVFARPSWRWRSPALSSSLSQVKINVTNAYAGSIAWSNFFSRLTHSHPGRVVWLVFNVTVALLLMEIGVYKTLEQTLALYSNVAIAWVGALVSDLVVNKPLGLQPSAHGIQARASIRCEPGWRRRHAARHARVDPGVLWLVRRRY